MMLQRALILLVCFVHALTPVIDARAVSAIPEARSVCCPDSEACCCEGSSCACLCDAPPADDPLPAEPALPRTVQRDTALCIIILPHRVSDMPLPPCERRWWSTARDDAARHAAAPNEVRLESVCLRTT